MGFCITDLAVELQLLTQWQQTPSPITEHMYFEMVVRGLKKLYSDTGRGKTFDKDKLICDEFGSYTYEDNLTITLEEYILLVAQILFFKRVQQSVNAMVSYTTDVLSVTQGDKPYQNLKNTLLNLLKERRIVFYKMTDYAIGT